jgi:hypothetical protein
MESVTCPTCGTTVMSAAPSGFTPLAVAVAETAPPVVDTETVVQEVETKVEAEVKSIELTLEQRVSIIEGYISTHETTYRKEVENAVKAEFAKIEAKLKSFMPKWM